MSRPITLSKSRYTAGLQCHKQLWWKVHEPNAPELTPDANQQAIFDQGTRVGEVARTYVPGGVLIEGTRFEKAQKLAKTREALAGNAPVIYEAAFESGHVFSAVDILERTADGFCLTEVKSTTEVKEHHVPDVAIQRWVLEGAGFPVTTTRVMHLDRECRAPDLSNLFATATVDAQVASVLPTIAPEVEAQLRMLGGPLPTVEIGDHCDEPYECPFKARCWPTLPPHHISTLSRISTKKRSALTALGVETIDRIPDNFDLTEIQARQRRVVIAGEAEISPALKKELLPFDVRRIAFLDFETVAPAIPVWDGCRPYDAVPAQFSCDVQDGTAPLRHFEWMATGPGDPRPEMARRVVEACRDTDIVVAFNAGFEKRCLQLLAEAAPASADELNGIVVRLKDLADPVRKGMYHPEFYGGYGLKVVVAALVPELAYADLEVAEGATASNLLMRLMFNEPALTPDEARTTTSQLREYCGRDTQVMVKLLDTLRSLA
ncbi:MAG TPA: DUF2779 domain-containing protein [Gemmatimonadales bacterium]|nr:DUF2779 domain-containing protein [Gemmatimonadales bacterium]